MKKYFKYIFIDSLQWLWIALVSIPLIGACITEGLYGLIFLMPVVAMIVRSVKMYNEKKNGTTS